MELSLEKLLDRNALKRVHSMPERYYLMVNPVGDIILAVRMTGPLLPYTSAQILNERGEPLYPQTRRSKGVMQIPLAVAREPFARIEISEEQFLPFMYHSANLLHHWYDASHRKICLRPGHYYVDANVAEVIGKEHLVRKVIAYGGRPLYQLRWNTEKTVADFPELLRAGLFFHKQRQEAPRVVSRNSRVRKEREYVWR